MKIKTRLFGEIEVDEEKVITISKGMIGFPELKRFLLIFDLEKDNKGKGISWMQSVEEPEFAMPVMSPLEVKEDYNPSVEDDYLKELGDLTPENMTVLVTVRVTKEAEKISVNLKAPIIINVDTKVGEQIIVEDDYPVRYEVSKILKDKKKGGEE